MQVRELVHDSPPSSSVKDPRVLGVGSKLQLVPLYDSAEARDVPVPALKRK